MIEKRRRGEGGTEVTLLRINEEKGKEVTKGEKERENVREIERQGVRESKVATVFSREFVFHFRLFE